MIEAEESEYVYNKLTPSRKRRDSTDKEQIVSAFQRFNVFREGVPPLVLQNIATKNLASESIQHSLLNAEKLAQVQLDEFVDQRLFEAPDSTSFISFNAALHRNKAQNFSSLYNVDCKESKGKKTTIKADRNILRLVTASKTGREIDLDQILQHELMPVPISLVAMNGSLQSI